MSILFHIMYNISLDSPQVALQNELNSVKIGRVVVEKINFYGSISLLPSLPILQQTEDCSVLIIYNLH